jgi:hypothetical protein
MKVFPFKPVLACLKNIGPGLCHLMIKAMMGMNGNIHKHTIELNMMSNVRLMNLLLMYVRGSLKLVNKENFPKRSGFRFNRTLPYILGT